MKLFHYLCKQETIFKMEESGLNKYLDEIGRESLLSAEEERDLSERILKGDEKALNRLVEANLKFVVSIANQYKGKGLQMEDLVSEGNIGLLKAAGRFDASKGTRFVKYAVVHVRQQIEKAISQQVGLYQLPRDVKQEAAARLQSYPLSVDAPLGHRTNMSLLSVIVNQDAPLADERVHSESIEDAIEYALSALDERESRVVNAFFGINQEHETMAEIAEDMDLKRERIRQIRDKAVRKLRKAYKSRLRELQRLIILLGLLLVTAVSVADSEKFFFVYNAANGLADNSAQTVNCTKTGRLVITTMGQINFYDGQKFSFIDPTTENTYPLSKYNGHAHLYFDKHHHLWLKRRQSLTCVNLTKEMFVHSIVDEFKELGMADKVEDLFVDGSSEVWLLTEKGLYSTESHKYYKVQPKRNLQELDTYANKFLLLFYDNGQLDALDLGTGDIVNSVKAYDVQRVGKYNHTTIIRKVGNNYYQIRNGKVNGNSVAILLRLDMEKWKFDTILETPYYLSNMVEHDSLLYVPSAYGYWTYNIPTGKLEHIEKLKMYNGAMLLTDINCMEFDRQGGLWVGTEKRGLLYARPFPVPFKAYNWTDKRALDLSNLMDRQPAPKTEYRGKSVNCVFRDSRGWDWVGTSLGLQLYQNKNSHLPQLFTSNEGLLNNVVHCIEEDHAHHIWVGTSYGICCLVIENDKVRYINRYNQWDGVPNESFVNGRSMIQPDGEIVMQALDHVITFNPDKMKTLDDSVQFEIYPKLIRMLVNGNDLKTGEKLGGKVILDRALTRMKEINLNYDQNSVSLTFSGLNFFRPQQTYYRVRQTGPGRSGKWEVYTPYNSQGLVDRNGLLHLPMASLQPGHYTIEVQASLLPDVWETSPYEWIINVNEPWWRTTGVMAVVCFLLLFLLMIYVLLYLRNANMRARRTSEEQSVIKRIKTFVERCDAGNGTILEPQPEVSAGGFDISGDFSPEFIEAMAAITPTVSQKRKKPLSMRELSNMAGLKLQDFYKLIASNIYKNPRPIAMQMMLNRAADMLLKNRQKDIAEISNECGFVSPNFFIASFFHKYQKTPDQYRSLK